MRRLELDGLRAVAATMVVLFHCLVAVARPHALTADMQLGPAGAVANGSSAVILFFVLSGSVLAGSFARDRSVRGTLAFLLRRGLRLYPAWLAALSAAWLASFLYPALPQAGGLGSFFQKSLAVHLDPGLLARSLAWPGTAYGQLPQGWTLALELQLSFVLPVLVLLAGRLGNAAVAGLATAGLVLGDALLLQYAFPFALGVVLERCRRVPAAVSAPVAAASGLLAATAFLLPPGWLWPWSRALGIAVPSMGAIVLVWLAGRRGPMYPVLSSAPLARIGEASYGLYLLHFPVVCLVAPFLVGDAPAPDRTTALARWLTLAAIVLPVSLVLALASWRWIERPAIAAGRRLTRRFAGPRSAA